MKRYRIIRGETYNGCIPITVYWVQVYEKWFLSGKWRNVKGFDTYPRAKELYDLLNN
ncbi:hypothetical protein [Coprobacter fastidiosus]|uniref:hypothetical protein n=1 Tax=Coprobacter fastidiosus TaxID=1099853 RepID=UPI003A95277B